jgi:large subunit ribosomal protein L29
MFLQRRISKWQFFVHQKLRSSVMSNWLNSFQNLNGKVSAGGAPDNPGRIREIRRTVARIKTEQNKRRNEA